jgi:hypothetical protein
MMNSTSQTLDTLISTSPRFQRAVHLRYDLRDVDTIDRYIPTTSAISAIDAILRGADPNGTQRAHVLHAAYGSGKSLLAVTLAALLENPPQLADSIARFVERLSEVDKNVGKRAATHLNVKRNRKFLPVIISGDEGDFSTALTRALSRALKEADLSSLKPQTRFNAAIRVLDDWKGNYPDTATALEHLLKASGKRIKRTTLSSLRQGLVDSDVDAYALFEQTYTQVTSGVTFDRFTQQSAALVYRDVAEMLRDHSSYSGIVVLWDEFGRYLEARTTQAFGAEAAQLQDFAETCNHSGEHQIHLLLFAHKELQSYANALPKAYQQEWSRIEGRFQRHNVEGDPYVAYRLIANTIQHSDVRTIHQLASETSIDQLKDWAIEYRLFDALSPIEVRDVIERTWPLHPLVVFALTRLSNKVAQNERTMFTFLTANEPEAMIGALRSIHLNDDDLLVRIATLWDYFSDAIRANTGVGGAHRVWSGVAHALDKVLPGDVLGETLIKALGVLTICTDNNVARPETGILCWAVGAETDEQVSAVETTLDNLRRRKVIVKRQIDGFWTFTSGSDIDFEQKLIEVLERTEPTALQLRRLLEQLRPAPFTLARRYNQSRSMTRYFTGLYRWSSEIDGIPWDVQLEQLDNADGLVVYVLAMDELSLQQAQEYFQMHPQIIYVLPHKPLVTLSDVLRELFGLEELNNDPELKQQDDRDRIQRELDWLIEDAEARLERELHALIDPRNGQANWISTKNEKLLTSHVVSTAQATRLLSEICDQVFSSTPEFNSEGLNKRYPTGQQISASQKVIDAIFGNSMDMTLGLEGHGPEIAAMNSLLVMTGILQNSGNGVWVIARPTQNPLLEAVWDCIDQFLVMCVEQGSQPIIALVETLIAPPFGIRQGVIPILLAAVMRNRVKATTIRHGDHAVHPVNGKLISDMIASPDEYSIEVGEWDEIQERLWQALFSRFNNHIHESERNQQPLTILKLSMLRWLQGLPAFCRDTLKLSPDAIKFRSLIRIAQTDPAKVLFQDLPALLNLEGDTSQIEIENALDQLISEISDAYLNLQRRLDGFASREFAQFSNGQNGNGTAALQGWIGTVQAEQPTLIREMRFGSLIAQQVVETVLQTPNDDNQFWERLSQAATGIRLRDWNDQSESKFYQTLLRTREDVERESEELVRGDAVVSVALQLPKMGQKDFRFRASDLTVQGKRILQNFKTTLEIAGRPLSVDERRQIVVAFLCHVMGEDIDE